MPIRDLGDASDIAAYFRRQPEAARFIEATATLPAAFATWQSLDDAGGAGRGSCATRGLVSGGTRVERAQWVRDALRDRQRAIT